MENKNIFSKIFEKYYLPSSQIGGSFWKYFISKAGFGYARNSAIEGGISEIIYYSYPGNSKGFNDYGHQIDQSKEVNACYVQNACYPTNSDGGNNNGNTGTGGGRHG